MRSRQLKYFTIADVVENDIEIEAAVAPEFVKQFYDMLSRKRGLHGNDCNLAMFLPTISDR